MTPPARSTEPRTGPSLPLYGFDIETDTGVDGLDPEVSGLLAAAVSTPTGDVVLTGSEASILRRLDELLAALPPGVIVTWNGARFDLPFVARRCELQHLPCGLELRREHRRRAIEPVESVEPVDTIEVVAPGRRYRARWHRHTHLDAYQVWRNDLQRVVPVSCSLKSVAALLGYVPVTTDVTQVHLLAEDRLARYVASDALLARCTAEVRWATAAPFIDARSPVWNGPPQHDAVRGTAPDQHGAVRGTAPDQHGAVRGTAPDQHGAVGIQPSWPATAVGS
jgi:DNA polymerase elongation subunit (family B)